MWFCTRFLIASQNHKCFHWHHSPNWILVLKFFGLNERNSPRIYGTKYSTVIWFLKKVTLRKISQEFWNCDFIDFNVLFLYFYFVISYLGRLRRHFEKMAPSNRFLTRYPLRLILLWKQLFINLCRNLFGTVFGQNAYWTRLRRSYAKAIHFTNKKVNA